MARRFEDSWRRIDRAIAHARVVTKDWPTLLDATAVPQIRSRGDGKFVVQVRVKRQDRNDFALELGEFFYQLRAALDAVAYKVVVLESGYDPPPRVDSIEFPVYTDSKRFKKCPLVTLTQFPASIKEWLESIQPYAFALSPDPDIVELGRRLKALHDCARKDRHRELHLLVAGIRKLKVSFQSENMVVSNVEGLPIDFFSDEVDFLTFDGTVIDPAQPTKIRLVSKGTIDLGMAEIPNHIGQELMGELEGIMIGTRHIVQVFEDGYPL